MSKESNSTATATTSGEMLLEVNGIEVVYDRIILVLKGVSLRVSKGAVVCLLGANGAGKTTTLKAVSNLLSLDRGSITKGSIVYRGEEVQRRDPGQLVEAGIVQVLEGRHCFPHLTVEENLLVGAYNLGRDRDAIAKGIALVYRYFPQLEGRRGTAAGYISGGEQQMLAIGRALLARPMLLLLDEPSMGLAPRVVVEIFEILKQLNSELGLTVLLAEQNARMALRYSQYGYVLNTGRVAMEGPAAELADNESIRELYFGMDDLARMTVDTLSRRPRQNTWME